ncbi:hypothetical protein F4779DRAFT_562178 [Xylariaceae sp. FL0662B]|nr:hypothetical protein F4779DRAFT_562178 [Xylariaceae sp. FL0662B]
MSDMARKKCFRIWHCLWNGAQDIAREVLFVRCRYEKSASEILAHMLSKTLEYLSSSSSYARVVYLMGVNIQILPNMQLCDRVTDVYKQFHNTFIHSKYMIFLVFLAAFVFTLLFLEIFSEKLDGKEKGDGRIDDENYMRAFLGRRKKTDSAL